MPDQKTDNDQGSSMNPNATGATAKPVMDTTSDIAPQADMDAGQLPISENITRSE